MVRNIVILDFFYIAQPYTMFKFIVVVFLSFIIKLKIKSNKTIFHRLYDHFVIVKLYHKYYKGYCITYHLFNAMVYLSPESDKKNIHTTEIHLQFWK